MVELRLVGLSREFEDGTRIGPVDLTVGDGDLVTILGPSGTGKTTTLRMIAGLIKPEKGSIYFDNREVTSLSPRDRKIGMVFQSIALFPSMTVFQNISFALEMAGNHREDIISRVEELSDLLGIRSLLLRSVGEISGGEAQRVALARALAKEPEILLLDEPLSSLDPQIRDRLQLEIKRIQERLQITTVYVTHSQEEAFAISDKIAIMKDGVIVQDGTGRDLYRTPRSKFVAEFISDGNIMEGRVIEDNNGMTLVDCGGDFLEVSGTAPADSIVAITFKPDAAYIASPTEPNAFKAGIKAIIPQAGKLRIDVIHGDSIISIFVEDGSQNSTYEIGQIVKVGFDPNDALIIEDHPLDQ